jgi:hypothetical protein
VLDNSTVPFATGSCVTIRGSSNPQRCIQSSTGRNIIEGITLFAIEHKGECLLLQGSNRITKGSCTSPSALRFQFTNESYQRYHLVVFNRNLQRLGTWDNQLGGRVVIRDGQLIHRIFIHGARDSYSIRFNFNEAGPGGAILERTGYPGFSVRPASNELSWQGGPLWFDFLLMKLINV